ncbi:Recombinase A [Roseburia hominis]|nr:Recombinase A [Roseburia hominis]
MEKSGAWYAYNGEKIGQGRENAKNFLLEHPAIFAEVEEKVKAQLFGNEEADA